MNPPAKDIAEMIEGSISGVQIGVDLFIGREPAHPDDCITIFDTPGFAPDIDIGGSSGYYRPSVQVRVRGNSYSSTWDRIEEIKQLLHGIKIERNNTIYEVITCSIEPSLLEWDKNNRAVFVATFNIQRKEK